MMNSVMPSSVLARLRRSIRPLIERRVDAGGRLVQQQNGGLVHQGHGEFQQFLLAERKAAGAQIPLVVEARRRPAAVRLDRRHLHVRCEHIEEPGLAVRYRDQHVLQAVHLAVDARGLERAQHAEARDLLHAQPRNFATVETDGARVDRVISDDRVEQRGFSRAVRSDHSGDAAARHSQRDAPIAATTPPNDLVTFSISMMGSLIPLPSDASRGPCSGTQTSSLPWVRLALRTARDISQSANRRCPVGNRPR